MPAIGVLYDLTGAVKAAWFWPDDERVCPGEYPAHPRAIETGDLIVLISPATETDYERITRGPAGMASVADLRVLFPGPAREELGVPVLPPGLPPGTRYACQPGYRRIVRVPTAGGRISIRRREDLDGIERVQTAYLDAVVIHVFAGGEPDAGGPPERPGP